MHAIILAAGMGKRLKELTSNNTKCMIRVNGITLIERVLGQLDKLGLNRIIIVVGYEWRKLMDYVNGLGIETPVQYIENTIYHKTNNIYSLFLAREYMKLDDTLLLESDLIVEDGVLEDLLQDERDTLALVDKFESWMDGTVMELDDEDHILKFIEGRKVRFHEKDAYYKTVNIYKFSRHFSTHYYIPFLEAYLEALGNNEYYEQVLKVITMLEKPVIKAKKMNGKLWYEIDDMQDLDIAESIFSNTKEDKVRRIQRRYGGYWRYPRMLDYCYLVNPYFPPKRLLEEIKGNFEILMSQYPSGMEVNSLLAAKNFGVKQEYIIPGNGASELIKAVLDIEEGKIGIIKPTFEEYPNRYEEEKCEIFQTQDMGFRYDENKLMEFFGNKAISMLVLVNPDNPSGNFIKKEGILRLCEWAGYKGIRLLVDESFADFAEGEDNTLIHNEILQKYPNLIVMKSISKSYGVPGIRLGILASAQIEYLEKIKKSIPIWNINSFAEFYMQIEGKYHRDYEDALRKLKETRNEWFHKLEKLPGLRVYPSQANYIMCEIINGISSAEMTERLLADYNIFIKDLTAKIGNGRQYIRLAVRNRDENCRLWEAMKKILGEK